MMSTRSSASRPSPDQPSPRKVEENNWSHQADDRGTLKVPWPPACCRSCAGHPAAFAASGPRRPRRPGWRLARRLPSRVPHNATDDCLIHLVLACFLVFWLTSAINRIVKEPKPRRHHSYAAASPLVHRVSPIPSAGASCLLASHPGRRDRVSVTEGKLIVSTLVPGQIPEPLFTKKTGFFRTGTSAAV